ncbi:MAG TPA: Scr1 family TA system antitoxin-like transcriptional regulator [Streptosporangiaceae bacterium]|nr:Scr1 family TA system antitoxin-like transcriptional regulator [Streptosporangiaceae bacterium]
MVSGVVAGGQVLSGGAVGGQAGDAGGGRGSARGNQKTTTRRRSMLQRAWPARTFCSLRPTWLEGLDLGATHRYDLPTVYSDYIGFEAEAQSISNYGSLFVPGLLQTEDYARAVIRGVTPHATAKQVESRVSARLERQALLTSDEHWSSRPRQAAADARRY